MLVAFTTLVSASLDPGEDFSGYVEEMARREQEERVYEAIIQRGKTALENSTARNALSKYSPIRLSYEAVVDVRHEVPLTRTGIAWESDKKHKFKK